MKKPEQGPVPISADLIIADVLDRWPETIPVFLKYKLDCVGCDMALFDTLADAIRIYQLPRQQFLDDLQQAIRDPSFGDEKG